MIIAYIYINIKVKMKEVQKAIKNHRKLEKTKKIKILPFIVQKPPLQNVIAYQKKGHWSQKQKLKYVFFLRYFKDKFTSRTNKRFCRIFKVMSDFIKTRTHNQCRSHHQKMEVDRNQVDSIINNVASKYHPRNYQQQYQKYQVELAYLNIQELQEYQTKSKNDKFSVQQSSNQIQKQNQHLKKSHLGIEKNYDFKNNQIVNNKNFEKIIVKQEEKVDQPNVSLIQFKQPDTNGRFSSLNFNYEVRNKIYDFMSEKKQKIQNRPTDGTLRQSQQEYDQRDQEYNQEKIYLQKLRQKNKIKAKPQKYTSNDQFFKNLNQKLDFKSSTPMGFDKNLEMSRLASQMNTSFDLNVEALQSHRLNCLNKATFHYNQMQLELRSVAQCEREKQKILGLELGMDMGNNPFQFPVSKQNQWDFRSFNQNF